MGRDLDINEAYDAARRVGITILSVIKNDIGIDKVNKVVKILGLVNCTEDFIYQPKVINGCSDILVEFLEKKKVFMLEALWECICYPIIYQLRLRQYLELKLNELSR